MRQTWVFVLLVLAIGYPTDAEKIESFSTIKEIIDNIIATLKDQLPDTVPFPDLTLNIPENDFLEGGVNISDSSLSGLKDFNITVQYRGVLIPIPTGFTIRFSDLVAFSNFTSRGQFLGSPILVRQKYGHFRTNISDLVLGGSVSFTLSPLNFSVSSLNISLGAAEFDIEGVVSPLFSRLLSRLLTNHVARILNKYEEAISAALINVVDSIIRYIVSNIRPSALNNVEMEKYKEEFDRAAAFQAVLEQMLTAVNQGLDNNEQINML